MRTTIMITAALASGMTLAGVATSARAQSYKQIYSFGGQRGVYPEGSLVKFRGRLLGITTNGGSASCRGGCGTIFTFDPLAGTEKVLYEFQGGSDGSYPTRSPTIVGGVLYGTTQAGGATNLGTVYSVNLSTHAERVVYNFQGGGDGSQPTSSLLNVGGLLYGVTFGNPGNSNGTVPTVYSIDTATNTEKVIDTLSGTPFDGLIAIDNILYGTTYSGGDQDAGTLYSINIASAAQTVLHSFAARKSDGVEPYGSLTQVGDKLYGTTMQGGKRGQGSIFEIDLKTNFEKVVYSFQPPEVFPPTDGANPYSTLINVHGVLYGTTTSGGNGPNCGSNGCGTVFSFDLATKTETVLHEFQGGSDGSFPLFGALALIDGTLYGNTSEGGAAGKGTLYSITP